MIELRINEKNYDGQLVEGLEDLYLDLPNCGLFILKGENGSGKSTLLNILAGLDTSYSGEFYFNEEAINHKNSDKYYHKTVSLLSQKPLFLENQTVLDNLKLTGASIGEIVKSLTEAELLNTLDLKASSLSDGERSRVDFIRACLSNSSVILLDEVTASLDKENAEKYLDLICRLSKNRLVVFSTHENDNLKGIKVDGIIDLDREDKTFEFEQKEDVVISKKRRVTAKDTIKQLLKRNLSVVSFFCLLFFIGFSMLFSGADMYCHLGSNSNLVKEHYIDYYLDNSDIALTGVANASEPVLVGNKAFDEARIYFCSLLSSDFDIYITYYYTDISSTIPLVSGEFPSATNEILIAEPLYKSLKNNEIQFSNINYNDDMLELIISVEIKYSFKISGVYKTRLENTNNSEYSQPSNFELLSGSDAYLTYFGNSILCPNYNEMIKKYSQGSYFDPEAIFLTEENLADVKEAFKTLEVNCQVENIDGDIITDLYTDKETYNAISLLIAGTSLSFLSLAFLTFVLYKKNRMEICILKRMNLKISDVFKYVCLSLVPTLLVSCLLGVVVGSFIAIEKYANFNAMFPLQGEIYVLSGYTFLLILLVVVSILFLIGFLSFMFNKKNINKRKGDSI